MPVSSLRPSTPTASNGSASPQQWSFLGGSIFTSPPEEAGDLLSESRRSRRSWWGEKDSSSPSKASRTEKKSDKEKRGLDKEKFAKEKKERSGEESKGGKDKVERVAGSEGAKEEVRKDAIEYPGEVEKDGPKVEVVGKVEVIGNGSHPVGKDKMGEACAMEEQLKAEVTEKTETEDDTPRSPRDVKSLRSLDSSGSTRGSQGSTKPAKKRWSLMIARKSTPEAIPTPSKGFTVDVAGPRFEMAKEPQGEICAGDNPSIYADSFVSPVPSAHIYTS